MARKKFDFKSALSDSASAIGGGYAADKVVEIVAEMIPEHADKAPFAPVALGFFLSQQKNKMAAAAGLGMIGASASSVLSVVGINGVGRSNRMKLSPGQKQAMLQNAKKSLKVAKPPMQDAIANAMEYNEQHY